MGKWALVVVFSLLIILPVASARVQSSEINYLLTQPGIMSFAFKDANTDISQFESQLLSQTDIDILRTWQEGNRLFVEFGDPKGPTKLQLTEQGFRTQLIPQKFIVEFNDEPAIASVTTEENIVNQQGQKSLLLERGKSTPRTLTRKDRLVQRRQEIATFRSKALADISQRITPKKGFVKAAAVVPTRVYADVFNGVALELTPDQVTKTKESPYVKAVHPDVRMSVSLHDAVNQTEAISAWALDALGQNCSSSGEECLLGSGVKIAIVDTGVDYSHADLGSCSSATFLAGNCEKVIGGYDFVNSDNDPFDDQGHGTHVAATAAGNNDDGDWVYEPSAGEYWGIAPNASLFAYKVLDSEGSGWTSDIIAGIEQAVDDGTDIISMSLGGSGTPDDALSLAVDAAANAGVIVVVAAGNSGPSEQTIGSPGTARKALTVGAVDDDDYIASFSSRGPVVWDDGVLVKPNIVAPGVSICAAQLPGAFTGYSCGTGHVAISGTSMATPMVSGSAAVLKQAFPSLTEEQIRGLLISTATHVGDDVFTFGGGRINLSSALSADVAVAGDLQFGLLDSGLEDTATISVTNIGSSQITASLSATNATDSSGTYSVISFTNTTYVLAPNQTQNITFTISVPAEAAGIFTGLVNVTVNSRSYTIPFSFASFLTLHLGVVGPHYPNFIVHDDTYQTVYYRDQWYDFIGNETTVLITPGNYTVIAINDFVIPDDPESYYETDQYVLATNISAVSGTVDVILDPAAVDDFTLPATTFSGEPLELATFTYGFASYATTIGYCSGYGTQGTCESGQSGGCYWDGGICYDKAVYSSYITSATGTQHFRLSEAPQNGFLMDIIFKYIGGDS